MSTWGFYNGIVGDEGLQITPFISKYDSTTGGYTVTGIGATRTNASTGAQTYSFDVVAGSATIGNGYTFGWIDGTPHAGNVSVAEWDGAGPVILFSYGNADPSVDLNDVLTPAMPSFTQSLSVQVTTTAIPEPSAMVMMAMAMCSLVAYAWRKRK